MRKENQDQSQRKQPIWLVMDSAVERNKHEPKSSSPKGKLWEIDSKYGTWYIFPVTPVLFVQLTKAFLFILILCMKVFGSSILWHELVLSMLGYFYAPHCA